jgi:hypothetical protein
MKDARRPIRIVFANCPNLDKDACTYLILAQNAVQSILEFETCDLGVYAAKTGLGNLFSRLLESWGQSRFPIPFKRIAARRHSAYLDKQVIPPLLKPLKPNKCTAALKPYLDKHDSWLTGLPPNTYGNWSIRAAPTVIVTETPFEGFYFGWCDKSRNLAVASISNWRRKHAPPSVLEYVLNQVQRYALNLTFRPQGGSHYPTRACLWDFDPNVKDARMSLLVGYLCGACEDAIANSPVGPLKTAEVEQIRELLSHRWIGRVEEPGSIAGNLKRVFGYDLSRTQGLSPSFADKIREAGVPEILKLIMAWLLGALTLITGVWLKKILHL